MGQLHRHIKGWALAAVCIGFWALAAGSVLALEVPHLSGRVNDLAGILSQSTEEILNTSLARLEEEDSTQIAVLTIPSLEGESLEDYALKVVEAWRLGQAKTDNGSLLLIAVAERKIRIEVGYGLEGKLTDLMAGRIIRNDITPAFRQGDYDQGVLNGVAAMVKVVKGEYSASQQSSNAEPSKDMFGLFIFLAMGLLFIGNIFRRRKPLAALVGGAFAPSMGALLFPGFLPFWVLLLGGGIGAFVVSVLAGTQRGPGIGSGGYFPGGFGGGFGGGGGGFGGGGGGFGGGGASGGW